jgi:hypothetical protein
VTGEIPTFSADRKTLTLAKGPIGDRNMSGAFEVENGGSGDITIFKNGTTTNGALFGMTSTQRITAIDPSAKTITLNTPATSTFAWTVSYHYAAANDTFEVDQSAPTVTFDPADGTTVQNQSPYVRIVFDEDEYPGDSYKTVTLSKASLLKPDGTTEDVLASFTTGDSIEYIWPSSDLALGEYALTVSGSDTAGNAVTDAKGKFTIAKRTVTLALRPGWNLVSLPDSVAATANGVNDVFSNAKIDVVLSYVAESNNWYKAVRLADGTLGLTGSILVLDKVSQEKGYWVHTTDIVSLKVDVPGIAAGAPSLPPSFKLKKGWNLVPYATTDLAITSRDADEYFTGLKWTRAFSYDNATNKFVGILPVTSDTVALGQAYWIFVTEDGDLTP